MELLDFIRQFENKHIFIQTHNFPDPDALGSAFGLSRLLEHFQVRSTLCYDGKIDTLSTRRILQEFDIEIYSKNQLREMTAESPIILVDTQKEAGNVTDLIGDEIACIDHHPTVIEIEYQFKDVRMVGACCTIIAEYFQKLNIIPDKPTATALLYGIKMDTNQFTRGVTEPDIEMYAFLNPYIDEASLRIVSSNTLEFSDLSAFGAVFQTIRVFEKVGIAYIPFSCPDALIAMISDFILTLNEVDFVIVYSKRDTGWKFSVRSEDENLDAGEIIHEALLGIGSGGGHACMAGGMIPIETVKEMGRGADTKICELFLDTIKRIGDEPAYPDSIPD
ncbi:MAG: DHH family phosphoesterase [Lachnospiraceae bacterium]|nr:DHH family phosphoesterase [Lachnospiraceae bacterium]